MAKSKSQPFERLFVERTTTERELEDAYAREHPNLLNIPSEILDDIFSYILKRESGIHLPRRHIKGKDKTAKKQAKGNLSVLKVCKQLNKEAIVYLYGRNLILISADHLKNLNHSKACIPHMQDIFFNVSKKIKRGSWECSIDADITLSCQPPTAGIVISTRTSYIRGRFSYPTPVDEVSLNEWKLANGKEPLLLGHSTKILAKHLREYLPPAVKTIVGTVQHTIDEGARVDFKTLRQIQHYTHDAAEETLSWWIGHLQGDG